MQKSLIFKDNKDKSFVYRWINKVNNKEYLGSTANAKRRLLKYYDLSSLNLVSMPIYKAILKHGHSNFIFFLHFYHWNVIGRIWEYIDSLVLVVLKLCLPAFIISVS